MKKTLFSVFSVFALTPIILFSMIFPISLLSFSMINSDSTQRILAVSSAHQTDFFATLPSDGSHPVGEYITESEASEVSRLKEIPSIGYTADLLPEGAKKILSQDLSQNGNMLINNTSYSIDAEKAVSAFAPSRSESDGPLVLVVHTHATESFLPEKDTFHVDENGVFTTYYDPGTETRSKRKTRCNLPYKAAHRAHLEGNRRYIR